MAELNAATAHPKALRGVARIPDLPRKILLPKAAQIHPAHGLEAAWLPCTAMEGAAATIPCATSQHGDQNLPGPVA